MRYLSTVLFSLIITWVLGLGLYPLPVFVCIWLLLFEVLISGKDLFVYVLKLARSEDRASQAYQTKWSSRMMMLNAANK